MFLYPTGLNGFLKPSKDCSGAQLAGCSLSSKIQNQGLLPGSVLQCLFPTPFSLWALLSCGIMFSTGSFLKKRIQNLNKPWRKLQQGALQGTESGIPDGADWGAVSSGFWKQALCTLPLHPAGPWASRSLIKNTF